MGPVGQGPTGSVQRLPLCGARKGESDEPSYLGRGRRRCADLGRRRNGARHDREFHGDAAGGDACGHNALVDRAFHHDAHSVEHAHGRERRRRIMPHQPCGGQRLRLPQSAWPSRHCASGRQWRAQHVRSSSRGRRKPRLRTLAPAFKLTPRRRRRFSFSTRCADARQPSAAFAG